MFPVAFQWVFFHEHNLYISNPPFARLVILPGLGLGRTLWVHASGGEVSIAAEQAESRDASAGAPAAVCVAHEALAVTIRSNIHVATVDMHIPPHTPSNGERVVRVCVWSQARRFAIQQMDDWLPPACQSFEFGL